MGCEFCGTPCAKWWAVCDRCRQLDRRPVRHQGGNDAEDQEIGEMENGIAGGRAEPQVHSEAEKEKQNGEEVAF